jgi:hypothetical protein
LLLSQMLTLFTMCQRVQAGTGMQGSRFACWPACREALVRRRLVLGSLSLSLTSLGDEAVLPKTGRIPRSPAGSW